MTPIIKTNANADLFPDVEVDYEDLLACRYWPNGRGGDGWIDCIGIILEIYRRAGLGLPDPVTAGNTIFEFQDLWESVTAADQLYDLVGVERKGQWHVEIQIRPGRLLSARAKAHVYSQGLDKMLRVAGATCYRLRTDVIPA